MGRARVYARMTTYAFHPAAELFPLIEGQEFADLVADIRAHGLLEPIALYNDQILDGRNRYRACLEAGVEPRFCEYTGDDAIAFVVSLNLKRRHLNETQRAMIAAKIANMRQGERTDLASIDAKSQGEVAELLNVSRSSVQRAAKIQSDGTQELANAVQRGDIKVSLGVRLAKLPRSEQREILGNSFDRNGRRR